MCACLTNAAGFNKKYPCTGHLLQLSLKNKKVFISVRWGAILLRWNRSVLFQYTLVIPISSCYWGPNQSFYKGEVVPQSDLSSLSLSFVIFRIFPIILHLYQINESVPGHFICVTVNIGCIVFSRKKYTVLPSSGYRTITSRNTQSTMDIDLGLLPCEVLPEFLSVSSHTVDSFIF